MSINIKRKIDNKENINGICGRKHNNLFGRKHPIIILNGNILYQILNKNLKTNQSYLKMILTLKH
jgi:hypothetical protein